MQKLQGLIALVTGGSSGIGLAVARLFVAQGATVCITGRRQSELDLVVTELGASAIGLRGDIAQLDDLDRLFTTIKNAHHRLDILFANAGVGEFVALAAVTEDHFDKTFSVNAKGTVFTAQRALRLMPNGSTIILNASIAALKGFLAFSVYAASKAAIRSYASGWIAELKDRRIWVNVVSLGTIPTSAHQHLGLPAEAMHDFMAAQSTAIPLGRVGSPDEVAKAVLFLASNDSSFINGVELFVDGSVAQI